MPLFALRSLSRHFSNISISRHLYYESLISLSCEDVLTQLFDISISSNINSWCAPRSLTVSWDFFGASLSAFLEPFSSLAPHEISFSGHISIQRYMVSISLYIAQDASLSSLFVSWHVPKHVYYICTSPGMPRYATPRSLFSRHVSRQPFNISIPRDMSPDASFRSVSWDMSWDAALVFAFFETFLLMEPRALCR